MNASELRRKYLEFFESKSHDVHPSGSLVPYDVTGRLDESLLFNGAGMIQFKPYFRGVAEPSNRRLTTAQKCVRTGDIECVGDSSHLTFFEMLGNFSFGDYFKAEAIAFSWEFLTDARWLGLDPKRLAFTVFESDDEAFELWSGHLMAAGIDPETRVFRLGEDTNYWPAGAFSSGPPGPCGPNSEMFFWTSDAPPPTSGYTREDFVRDEGQGLWLEIWNDVFIQFEWQGELKNPSRPADGYRKTGMPDLPFRSIDTGMGLERTAAVLGGKKSVYDIDIFAPILQRIGKLSGHAYGTDDQKDTAFRIIADHIRTSVFCIADGILPANNGRGYVLRRLIRRAVLKGQRVLGFDKPFFCDVFPAVVESMGDHYGELTERKSVIEETLRNEEALFRRTLDRGLGMVTEHLVELKKRGITVYDGPSAFMLYDTFGFPLEVTREICEESGFAIDEEGYEAAMHEAQERSRAASVMDDVYGGVAVSFEFEAGPTPTTFVGYEFPSIETGVVGALPELDETGACTGRFGVALAATPFYTESGGQISDTGLIIGRDFEFNVVDVIKQAGVVIHLCEPHRFDHPEPITGMKGEDAMAVLQARVFGQHVAAAIDSPRRMDIMRHHTATHLMHAALRKILGAHVTQAGSMVGPDYLRFDFTHGRSISPQELEQIEAMVNEQILANDDVITYVDLPLAEAKARGAMALFGEKYGDRVRMIEIGEFSRELCGGTHVAATGQIGFFKIMSEGSAASGVRRIEAVAGHAANRWVSQQVETLKAASNALKTNPKELLHAIDKTLETLKEERKKREQLALQSAGSAELEVLHIGDVELAVQKLAAGEAKDAQTLVNKLVDGQPQRVALVGLVTPDGKIAFACKVGASALTKGAHAGNLLRDVAKIAGGGGGGKPDFATAGGRDPQQMEAALNAAAGFLSTMVVA